MHWHSQANPNRARRVVRWGLALGAALLAGGAARAADQTYDCVVDPSESVALGSPVPGLLAEVLVKRGDVVTAGQVVARLESGVEAATLKYNRALAASTARIDAQAARLDLAQARLERSTGLLKKGVVAQDKFDELEADVRVGEQDLERERTEKALAEIEAEKAEAQLAQRTIRSPISGVVSERNLSAGEYVSQDNHIATIAKLEPLNVETFLPVEMYPAMRVGMTGTVFPDPPISGRYDATIVVVDHVFDPSSGTFGVRLELENPDNRLPAGQRCQVSFSDAVSSLEPAGQDPGGAAAVK